MTNHTQLLNYLAEKIGAETYLEIGVFNPDHNFNKINVAEKECVDPDPKSGASHLMTSDEFLPMVYDNSVDLIFIDGLHHADQVKRDFENSLRILSKKGFIVIHDCNPHSEKITHVPRDSGEWCGDVYKFIMTLPSYDGIDFRTIDMDYGCCVVRRAEAKGTPIDIPLTWDFFEKHKGYINLIDLDDFYSWINNNYGKYSKRMADRAEGRHSSQQ